jgi:hypothetical protein
VIPVTELPKTILLKGDWDAYEEGRAAGAITPGHLIAYAAAGTLVVHPTAGGDTPMLVAMEDALQGRTIADAYASGDLVRFHVLKKGDEFYGLLPAATAAVTPATLLESAGNGMFQILTTGKALAKPRESVDNSAGGAAARCKMQVI